MKTKTYYVYIMASRSLTLYTGVTNSIYRRALQHKRGEVDGFTKRYNINRLVFYEIFHHVSTAIARETQIKSWTRAKRLALIKTKKPTWQDLAEGWGEKVELQIPFDALPFHGRLLRAGSSAVRFVRGANEPLRSR